MSIEQTLRHLEAAIEKRAERLIDATEQDFAHISSEINVLLEQHFRVSRAAKLEAVATGTASASPEPPAPTDPPA